MDEEISPGSLNKTSVAFYIFMVKFFLLAFGGIAGTLSRYALAGFTYRLMGTTFPYGTLVVNVLGCFLIGFLSVLAEKKFLLGPNARLFLMAGFCGAFTTFSTFILETDNLLKDGEIIRAFLNVVLSVAVGFVVFRLGGLLGEVI